MNTNQKLYSRIDALKHVRVLVVGDVMVDFYLWSEVNRISPEAPVPVALVTSESSFLGGAANVAHNAHALGAQVSLVGVVGNDSGGEVLKQLLSENNIANIGIFTEVDRQTTVKKRVVSGTQQLLRIDNETTSLISVPTQEKIKLTLLSEIQKSDVVIISDYYKGFFTQDIISVIFTEAKKHNKKVFVDSKDKNLMKFSGAYIIKPNKEEAESFAQERFTKNYSNLEDIGKRLVEIFNSKVVVTLGKDGTAFFEDESFCHKTTKAQQVFDVSGAGDTMIATIATTIAAGGTLEEAVDFSNIAAGYVISHFGTGVCSNSILKELIENDIKLDNC